MTPRRRRSRLPAMPDIDPREVAALIGRVHGRACAWCSAATTNPTNAAGWPTCSSCASGVDCWGAEWPSAAVAVLLEVDPTDLPPYALGRITAPRYADHRDAAPDRPGTPWGFVGVIERADLLDELRIVASTARDLAAGGPCSRCGALYSVAWHDGPEGRPIDARCATEGLDGPRTVDAVAARLVGLAGAPTGCADALGFAWAADTDAPLTGVPWGHVDVDAMRARAAVAYPLPGEWSTLEAAHRAGVTPQPPVLVGPPVFDGGPCVRCGVIRSTGWSRGTCAGCEIDAHDIDGHRIRDTDHADRVAAQLAGVRGTPTGIAAAIGFEWFANVKRARPSEHRWQYVDLAPLRAEPPNVSTTGADDLESPAPLPRRPCRQRIYGRPSRPVLAGSGRVNADARIIGALVAGDSHAEAARAAGVSARTVRRRIADADFAAQLAEHRGAVMGRCADRLAATATSATVVLAELMADADSTPPAVRLGACRAVLEQAARYIDAADVEARLTALEAHLLTA